MFCNNVPQYSWLEKNILGQNLGAVNLLDELKEKWCKETERVIANEIESRY